MARTKILHFAAYSLINTFHGIIAMSFGPIIPYFTRATHRDETDFSFIFFAKAIGFLCGGFLVKVLTKYFNYHQLCVLSALACSSALIASSLDLGYVNLAITMFVAGVACCVLEVLCNMCMLDAFS